MQLIRVFPLMNKVDSICLGEQFEGIFCSETRKQRTWINNLSTTVHNMMPWHSKVCNNQTKYLKAVTVGKGLHFVVRAGLIYKTKTPLILWLRKSFEQVSVDCLWFDRPVKITSLRFWVLDLRSLFCRCASTLSHYLYLYPKDKIYIIWGTFMCSYLICRISAKSCKYSYCSYQLTQIESVSQDFMPYHPHSC